jgi:hypothetical protein
LDVKVELLRCAKWMWEASAWRNNVNISNN